MEKEREWAMELEREMERSRLVEMLEKGPKSYRKTMMYVDFYRNAQKWTEMSREAYFIVLQ